jgi:AcrR family transcriptional regulator
MSDPKRELRLPPSVNAGAGVRARLIHAFSRMLLGRAQGRPSMRAVVNAAGVARSTLYEHFKGRDDLLLEALRHPLGSLADAGAGRPHQAALEALLEHLRERRADTVELLEGPLKGRILRLLRGEIRNRDPQLPEAAALQIAALLVELLRLWIAGETPASSADMAGQLARAARAQRTAS